MENPNCRALLHGVTDDMRQTGINCYGNLDITALTQVENPTVQEFEDMGMWRPQEPINAIRHMKKRYCILIKGRAGCGKGAVLTGIWQWLIRKNIMNTFLDGHYQNPNYQDIIDAITRQQSNETSNGGVVCFDSMDYLYAGHRKVRKLNLEKHTERTQAIFDALKNVPIIVGTLHEESWQKELGDPKLIEVFSNFFNQRKTIILEVEETFPTKDQARSFLIKKGIEERYAIMLTTIEQNTYVRNIFLTKRPSLQKWQQFLWLMNTYATLKLITQDVFNEHIPLLALMRGDDQKGFWEALIEYVFAKDYRLTFHAVVVKMKNT